MTQPPRFDPEAAWEVLRERIPAPPEVVAVLGSGLSGLSAIVDDRVEVPFSELPGFPATTVVGHAGRYVAGSIEGRPVLLQAGRFHLYEGHPLDLVCGPVRVAHAAGASTLLLTNAAGGVGPGLDPGAIMLIDDHIDLTWRSPLAGAPRRGEQRFPDMSAPYDRDLQRLAMATASAEGIALRRGVYAAVVGPSYETRAEVRMLAGWGADAIGMSTVPEVITARALGLRCLAFTLVTNRATGLAPEPLSHEDVLEVGRSAGVVLERLIRRVIARLDRVGPTARA